MTFNNSTNDDNKCDVKYEECDYNDIVVCDGKFVATNQMSNEAKF